MEERVDLEVAVIEDQIGPKGELVVKDHVRVDFLLHAEHRNDKVDVRKTREEASEDVSV